MRLVADFPFCSKCLQSFVSSPESLEDFDDWERTGGIQRPHPDPWWERSQERTASYIRRVQAERRNGGAA